MADVHQAHQTETLQAPLIVSDRAACPSPDCPDKAVQVGYLRLLGGFELTLAGGVASPTPMGQRILALLALRDRPTARTYIAGNLWPDRAEKKAAGSLRSALWRLKMIHSELICCGTSTLSLNTDMSVDTNDMVDQSRQLITDGRGGAPSCLDIELFSCDLLPDWYDDWVYFERERLRHLRLASLERHAARMLEADDYLAAIHAADAAVAGEPLRESAHRILVQAHILEGNYCEAISQYETYARLLNDALGLEPSPLMADLICPLMRR